MANLLVIEPGMKIEDPENEVHLVEDKIQFSGEVGDIVSVIAISDVSGLTYHGLKWPVDNLDVSSGWIGISNKIVSSPATISLKKGRVLVFRCLA